MYLPTRPFRICPYSRQKEYCQAPELRIGSVSASTSDLLYNCGEKSLLFFLHFPVEKRVWSFTYIATVMWGLRNQGSEGFLEIRCCGRCHEAAAQPRGHIFHVLPSHLCKVSKKLGWTHRETSPCAHTRWNCKEWCKVQMNNDSCQFGFNKGFLSPSEAGLVLFFWSLWRSPCSVLLSGKLCWNDVISTGNNQGSHSRENVVLTNWEDCGCWRNFALDALKPLLSYSKGIQND